MGRRFDLSEAIEVFEPGYTDPHLQPSEFKKQKCEVKGLEYCVI